MTLRNEAVMDTTRVGTRTWRQCDGCGAKEGLIESANPYDRDVLGPPRWAHILLMGDKAGLSVFAADLCPKCLSFRVDSAIDMARSNQR